MNKKLLSFGRVDDDQYELYVSASIIKDGKIPEILKQLSNLNFRFISIDVDSITAELITNYDTGYSILTKLMADGWEF